ncbi:MAG: glycosyltransferase family 4 protein [Chitinophagaceae bacterium]|nr:glycosyltransferase family 4 protein [Chitinophagaceae bacterium]MBK9570303.1 glycosyltransferase family 4 protein [Chitinophagaceae bacterium]MBL0271989.1 glycosyltransferase family 4 protein [Chitinophagaceae bacterium]
MHKIIFDCERMKYPFTGLYHYCQNLGKYLEKNIDLRQEQLFFYSPPGEQDWSYSPSNHLTQNPLHKFVLPAFSTFDIWHATYQNTHYMPMLNRKIKVVLSIHDLNFLYDEKKSAAKKQKYLRYLQGLINRADAIICISDFSKKDVLQHCDVKNKPLYVIHNGTNLLLTPELTALSYKPRKPFLFSIGVINRKKNFHVLLPLLKKNTMELLIAGKNDDQDYLSFIEKRSRDLGVEENVHLLGHVTENEKSWYFNNCRAFAFPSISEGFGLPVAEAMSCGKPLFLSDRTALPEIGGDVSFYFHDFNPDHIQQVFTTGMEKYNENGLKEKIKERGTSFCWHKSAKQYLDVYRSLY